MSGGERLRSTRVEVDLTAIRRNVSLLKPPGVELMAVVKGDGYGHGAVPVARAALEAGATWLGVALVEEGIELREAGIDAPILVLSEAPAGFERDVIEAGLTPTVCTDAGLEGLAGSRDVRDDVGVHVKVDTGMHRIGIWPPGDAAVFCDRVADAGLTLDGLFTHFARSEDDELITKGQLTRFLAVVAQVRAAGHEPTIVHAANSAATILHPDTHLDLVRTGIAIYGVPPGAGVGDDLGLRPAMRWVADVTMVKRLDGGERVSYGHHYELPRQAWVATVPVGYADGYPRRASSRAEVLIRGVRCPVAGTVTMDQLIVDCGDLEVRPGDEVVLLGRQGEQEITAEELGVHADSIGYEIVTRVGGRVPREHVG